MDAFARDLRYAVRTLLAPEGLRLAAAGAAIGILLSIAAARSIRSSR